MPYVMPAGKSSTFKDPKCIGFSGDSMVSASYCRRGGSVVKPGSPSEYLQRQTLKQHRALNSPQHNRGHL